jgi:sucrose-phosphate synthase
MASRPLYVAMISVHGLIRGHEMELGRDADTGGQVKYIVELAREVARDRRVERVDLLTRRIEDPAVDDDYAAEEDLGDGARIVRLRCGPDGYIPKESLWPYLDGFVDQAILHFRAVGRVPDWLHAHYADAGYVASQLAGALGLPMVFTGHSLGRDKRRRLLDHGMDAAEIESKFNIATRIEAEEIALDTARFVVASTTQEVDEQYARYDRYSPSRMVVIPPGVDLDRFHPPRRGKPGSPIRTAIDRFLEEPEKPMIVAMARADRRKNLASLVHAYGRSESLRERANLVVVAGSRDDVETMDDGPREVLTELLLLIDRYDLYGKAAYPKRHSPDDVPDLYRLAARRRGVFVNPALTEPFGLTLIEAAASGLPVCATHDGGPTEILSRCENGTLIDPLDVGAMAETLESMLADRTRWKRWSRQGLSGTRKHYTWKSHAKTYLRFVQRTALRTRGRRLVHRLPNKLVTCDRLLICDIDDTLLGDDDALVTLIGKLRETGDHVGFGVATGRHLESATKVLRDNGIPTPDVLITSVGAEIHYGGKDGADDAWSRHLDYRWNPTRIREVLDADDSLELQEEENQRRHKISYYVDGRVGPDRDEIVRRLRHEDLPATVIHSHGQYLDLLPVHASKGKAVRYLASRWGLPMDRVVTVGDSGNDEEMLSGDACAIVVGNYSPELEALRGRPRIRFVDGRCARGVLEGLEHYDFFGAFEAPPLEDGASRPMENRE